MYACIYLHLYINKIVKFISMHAYIYIDIYTSECVYALAILFQQK